MSTKTTLLSILAALVIGLAVGRFTLPAKVVTKIQTVEVQKVVVQDHTVTVVKTVKEPNGAVEVTQTTHNDVVTASQDQIKQSLDKETLYNTSRWSLNVIAAVPLGRGIAQPVEYGLSASYRLIGPFSVGAMGLQDGTVGVSVGITF
jgi:hypothetical protein